MATIHTPNWVLVPDSERIMKPPTLPLFMTTLLLTEKGKAAVSCIQICPLSKRKTMLLTARTYCRYLTFKLCVSFQSSKPATDNPLLPPGSAWFSADYRWRRLTHRCYDASEDVCVVSLGLFGMRIWDSRSKHSKRSFLFSICEHSEVCSDQAVTLANKALRTMR